MVVDKKDNHRSAVSVPASRLCRVALLEFLTGPDIQLAEVQFTVEYLIMHTVRPPKILCIMRFMHDENCHIL